MNINQETHTQHISQKFNEELDNLRNQVLIMGGLVEKQVVNAVAALENNDTKLAEQVVIEERTVDQLEIDIDEDCVMILARRQPTAFDLRMVLAVIRTIHDLERIGDEANKIAKMALRLAEEGQSPRGYAEIRHITTNVRSMLASTLDAFARYDSESAYTAIKADEQIDLDYRSALREMITYMMEDPRSISRVMNITWVLRSLERIGDHAKNICEHIVFLVDGEDIRHEDNLDEH